MKAFFKVYKIIGSPFIHTFARVLGISNYGCRFYPTCSEYGAEIVFKQGWLRGGFKIFWRFLRCNPLGKGGIDLP